MASYRCATCLAGNYPQVPRGGISPQNICSSPYDRLYQDACDPIWQNTCSCGQMLPEIRKTAAFQQNLAYVDQNLHDTPPIDGAEVDLKEAWI